MNHKQIVNKLNVKRISMDRYMSYTFVLSVIIENPNP